MKMRSPLFSLCLILSLLLPGLAFAQSAEKPLTKAAYDREKGIVLTWPRERGVPPEFKAYVFRRLSGEKGKE